MGVLSGSPAAQQAGPTLLGSDLKPRPIYLQRRSLIEPQGEPATTIFLTFDDGPTVNVTSRIADVLARHRALGSFFVVGRNARSPQTRRILADLVAGGHLIANHTFEHSNSYANEAAFEQSLRLTTRLLSDFLPPSGLIFFRSPGGTWNSSRSRWTNLSASGGRDQEFASYVGPMFWNVGGSITWSGPNPTNAADWRCWSQHLSPALCAQGYLAKIRANVAAGKPSLVLMHDLRVESAQMLELVLQGLAQDPVQYEFKRLDMARWPFEWVRS